MIYLAFFLLLGAELALADDTEIYGATEISSDSRVRSNVLFIMDTSGSMQGEVSNTLTPYDPSVSYSGSYYYSDIYNGLNDSPSSGHARSAFQSSSSYQCSSVLNDLAQQGKVLGEFQQYRNGWRSLRDGSDSPIRCDRGKNAWVYSGNYLNWYHNPSNVTTSTRMEVVVDVVNELTYTLKNINLGLMRFDQSSDGGMIDVPVSPIENSASQIRSKLAGYYPKGGTPLEETLYEAALYYRGENWRFGNDSQPNPSVAASRNGSQYQTPISTSCQKNHVILLTDGEPTSDTNANGLVKSKVAGLSLPSGLSRQCSGDGDCLDELAYWMKNSDHSTNEIGNQDITTYTIGGFELKDGVELLKRTANWGGGRYFEANDTQGLNAALESIFLDILATDSTFTAPAVSVNAFNATEHRDELFYALFRPDDNINWAGNLKKYKLSDEGIVYGANSATPAISESTGFFNDGVFDFWNNSAEPDGKKVSEGGIANLLEPHKRVIYSEDSVNYLGNFTSFANETSFDVVGEGWTRFTKIRDWTMGFDVDDQDGDGDTSDARYAIGDPLHSEPLVINYGGTEANPIASIFFGTNQGFIHSIDTESGNERWAYLPTALHKLQKHYYDNSLGAKDKPYGMDGLISTWIYDENQNGKTVVSTNAVEGRDHVYIYAGMRRGGRNYYAMDVSIPNRPKLLFKIEGGKGEFQKLGQTWSKMTVTKVYLNGKPRFVAFFGGGYDTKQDSNDLYESDDIGNAIYMVDATTGERLWWASNSGADLNIAGMKNGIAAPLSLIDINGDGFTDYLFAADTGGKLIRVDFNPRNKGTSTLAIGGVIANFNDGTENGNRRFYNKPNVAMVKDKQYGDYLSIAVGSGHRAHPIMTKNVENRMYVIRDDSPYYPPNSYVVKTEAPASKTSLGSGEEPNKQLVYNATSILKNGASGLTDDLKALMQKGGGWYVSLDIEGEKVLAESTTFAGAIIFTTFSPSGSATSACGPDLGTARLYVIDQRWGTSVLDLDGDGDVDENDTSKVLSHSGISPRPVIIYRKDGGKSVAIGTEVMDDSRFNVSPNDEKCDSNGNCEQSINMCETNNCYVTPSYWRQNNRSK